MYIRAFTYEYRVYTSIQKNFNRGRADAYGETTQCTYGLSDWFEVGQNQLKARQSRKNQVYLGLFVPKSVTMSAWPIAGLLVCVLYLISVCNCFWHESGQVYLILAKTLFYLFIYSFFLFITFTFQPIRRRFYPRRSSGQAVVTGVVPSPPRYVPLFFVAHRVQHSHCSSIFIECSQLTLSRFPLINFLCKKKSL